MRPPILNPRLHGSLSLSKKLIPILASIWILTACTTEKKEIKRAFYYWRTTFTLNQAEQAALKNNNIDRLYIRYFDIDKAPGEKEPRPVSSISFPGSDPKTNIVPVVFITNRTFKGDTDPKDLAQKTWIKIQNIHKNAGFSPIREIQLDCDWTQSTQKKYFQFLSELKKHISAPVPQDAFTSSPDGPATGIKLPGANDSTAELDYHHLPGAQDRANPTIEQSPSEQQQKTQSITLSATIRLHQVKFKGKTGIPPVGRGMLMCYNVGNVTNPEETNSILSIPTVKSYLSKLKDYPLELDIALPIFSWAALYRNGKLIDLLHNTWTKDLQQNPNIIPRNPDTPDISQGDSQTPPRDQPRSESIRNWVVTTSHYFQNRYLYKDDQLRVESVTPKALQELSAYLAKQAAPQDRHIVLYHLTAPALSQFTQQDLNTTWQTFGQ